MKANKLFLSIRTTLIATIFSGIFLVGCTTDKITQHNDIVQSWYPKVLVLYAAEDIQDGTSLSARLLREKEVELNKIPQDAITGGTLRIIGRVTKYRIPSGQIIRYHDLFTEYGAEENIIILTKEEQEKLKKKAAQNHKSTKELIRSLGA